MDTKEDYSRSEEKGESIFGNWAAADSRLVIISVFSAFAGNLLTVLVVGLAIVASRSMLPRPATTGNLIFFWASAAAPLVGLLFIYFILSGLRRDGKPHDTLRRIMLWTFIPIIIFDGFYLLSYMLTLIGIATKVSG